jgi:hypothetical protein
VSQAAAQPLILVGVDLAARESAVEISLADLPEVMWWRRGRVRRSFASQMMKAINRPQITMLPSTMKVQPPAPMLCW